MVGLRLWLSTYKGQGEVMFSIRIRVIVRLIMPSGFHITSNFKCRCRPTDPPGQDTRPSMVSSQQC